MIQPMAENPFAARGERQDESYDPLPPLVDLPAWVWRKLPRAGKIGLALLPLVVVGLIMALAPGINETKDRNARAEQEQQAQVRAQHEARVRREQQPRFAAGAPATDIEGRGRLLDDASASVGADARERAASGEFRRRVERVECEPFPRTVTGRGAHQSLESRFGRYACLAITARFGGNELSEASEIGYPYRVRIDFETGRYGFCKVVGRPGEGLLSDQAATGLSRACGGS